MNNGRPHLSHSQMETYVKCPKQWEWRYVKGIKSPPGVAAVIGKATHVPIAKNLQQKLDWGIALLPEEVKDAAADAVHAAWVKEPPVRAEGDPDEGQAVDVTVRLAALHAEKVAPAIEPVAVEQAFVIEMPGPYDFLGIVDVETPTMIRDTKTSKKKPADDAATRSQQLVAYHLRATIDGRPDKTVALDYLVKGRHPSVVTLEAAPTGDDHNAFLRRFSAISHAIQSGSFPPTSPTSWACSQKWCGYWENHCEFGRRQRVSVGLIDPARLTARFIRNPHDDDAHDADTG